MRALHAALRRSKPSSPAPGTPPGHTSYQLPDMPDTYINKVLAACYATGGPLAFTRAMLWQMEVRKAASPGSSQRGEAP
jgi:hypothetical protein